MRTQAASASRSPVGHAGHGFAVRESSGLDHCLDHPLEVTGSSEVCQVNPGRVARLARRQTHPAARPRCHQARNDSENGATRSVVRSDIERASKEHEQVGRPGTVCTRRMERQVGLKTTQARRRSSRQVDGDQWVVHQVRPDPGQVQHWRDVEGTQAGCRTVPSRRRIPVARVPEHAMLATTVSGRTVRFARDRATARYVTAVLIRMPSRTLRGVGPTPTAPGRLWSST